MAKADELIDRLSVDLDPKGCPTIHTDIERGKERVLHRVRGSTQHDNSVPEQFGIEVSLQDG